jgi:hypothetical protein
MLGAGPGLQAAAGLLAAGLSLLEGLLLARDLGPVRRSFQRADARAGHGRHQPAGRGPVD